MYRFNQNVRKNKSFQAGTIYELRLMMDFSGSNRGYFFVRYTKREEARTAVRLLNNYEIKPNKFLGVIQSVDNRKLWISGIPKNRTAEEIKVGLPDFLLQNMYISEAFKIAALRQSRPLSRRVKSQFQFFHLM